jgi:hypothetical protein
MEERFVPTVEKKKIQIRMPAALYSQARMAVDEGLEEIPSINDFVVKAVKEKLRRIREAKIDAAFSRMGSDEKYLRATAEVSRDFADSDWEAFKVSE